MPARLRSARKTKPNATSGSNPTSPGKGETVGGKVLVGLHNILVISDQLSRREEA